MNIRRANNTDMNGINKLLHQVLMVHHNGRPDLFKSNAKKYTDEEKRGMHIGKQLYEHVVNFAKEQGCYNVTLNVWSCNKSAMKFYEKCGLLPQKIGMELIL